MSVKYRIQRIADFCCFDRLAFLFAFSTIFSTHIVLADAPIFELEIRNHLFEPPTLTIPAGIKIKLVIFNRDPSPEEFESYELNREKVVLGGQQAIIFIGPLKPGEYPFFGEFHPNTAVGKLLVE